MKFLKKWWFWLILALFVLVNIWMSNDKSQPAEPNQPQLNHSNIGTH
ncbi:MAG TPA: hypothetical protein VFT51_09995 [Bacillales bacterium]|nr:hypothetical protein [Bacillales bacterium]